tara:strand:+ start:670 stop:792 length:123 start_codon:yes stop_codon:yes gene_type:complete
MRNFLPFLIIFLALFATGCVALFAREVIREASKEDEFDKD